MRVLLLQARLAAPQGRRAELAATNLRLASRRGWSAANKLPTLLDKLRVAAVASISLSFPFLFPPLPRGLPFFLNSSSSVATSHCSLSLSGWSLWRPIDVVRHSARQPASQLDCRTVGPTAGWLKLCSSERQTRLIMQGNIWKRAHHKSSGDSLERAITGQLDRPVGLGQLACPAHSTAGHYKVASRAPHAHLPAGGAATGPLVRPTD